MVLQYITNKKAIQFPLSINENISNCHPILLICVYIVYYWSGSGTLYKISFDRGIFHYTLRCHMSLLIQFEWKTWKKRDAIFLVRFHFYKNINRFTYTIQSIGLNDGCSGCFQWCFCSWVYLCVLLSWTQLVCSCTLAQIDR